MHPHFLLLYSTTEPTAVLGILRVSPSESIRSQCTKHVAYIHDMTAKTSYRFHRDERTHTARVNHYCCTPKLRHYSAMALPLLLRHWTNRRGSFKMLSLHMASLSMP